MKKLAAIAAAAMTLAACGNSETSELTGGDGKANASAQAALAIPDEPKTRSDTNEAAADMGKANQVRTVERRTSDGRLIRTRELVGPNVLPADGRPIRADEIAEIEAATGRPYQEGDTIHGRAEEVPKGE